MAAQSYRYDSRGRIIGVTNGNQHDTAYDMDNWGRITKSKNPDGGKEGYTYDYAGNITSTIDGNGNTITYRYNSQGKVCETIDQDGNSERFYYDREGRLSLYIVYYEEEQMRYFITGIVLVGLGVFFMTSPIEKLYELWENIPSPIAPRIGGAIAFIVGVFLLIVQISEWMNKV